MHRLAHCTPPCTLHTALHIAHRPAHCTPPCTLHTALCIAHRPAHCIPPCALHTADEQWRRDLGDVILNEEEIKLLDAMRNRCASAHLWSGVQLVPGAVFPGPWRSLHLPVYGLVSIWYQEQCFQDPGGVCICLFTAWCLTGTRSNVSRIMEEFARSALRNTHCSAPEYRLKMLAEAAVAYSVRLLVDAEHTFYQPVRASDLLYLRR